MTWIQLASGNGYDFEVNCIFGEFDLRRDIARPLTQSRFVKHSDRNWPVAVHSVAVARTIEQVLRERTSHTSAEIAEAAAAGLMHDAHEAVIGDIPTPVAMWLGYDKVKELKANIDAAVFRRLQLPMKLLPTAAWKAYVNFADVAALEVERRLFMSPEPRAWGLPSVPHHWLHTMYGHVKELLGDTEDWRAEDLFVTEYKRLVQPFVGTGVNA